MNFPATETGCDDVIKSYISVLQNGMLCWIVIMYSYQNSSISDLVTDKLVVSNEFFYFIPEISEKFVEWHEILITENGSKIDWSCKM